MNKYKILNLIKRIPLIPFIIFYKVAEFICSPLIVVTVFLMTDWEDKYDRSYSIGVLKRIISFGFWKH